MATQRQLVQEIVLAGPRGFCAGVDRAIDIVEQALLRERVLQRAHHVLLADQLGKRAGTPLAGEDLCH